MVSPDHQNHTYTYNASGNISSAGRNPWTSSTIDDELQFLVDDFRMADFADETIAVVLEQQFRWLDSLGVINVRPTKF